MKRTLLSLAVIAILAGCSGDDGDDGAIGPQGPQGAQGDTGSPGTPGQDATLGVSMSVVGRAQLNPEDPEGAAEIVQYHAATQTVFAINSAADAPTVEMIDISGLTAEALSNPLTSTNLTSTALVLETSANGIALGGPNSIAVSGDWMAIAVAADAHADNGVVLFYNGLDAATPVFVKAVTVGNLPDMVTFTPDGSKVIVANEGEPAGDYSVDPEGSVAIINMTDGMPADTATILNFTAYNGMQDALEAQGMHFPNPNGRTINGNLINVSVAQDLEPEYIAATNEVAYVALQENNGLAIVDLTDNSLEVVGLGFKDWSDLLIDGMEDGAVSFGSYDNLYGMYQPDTIATYSWNNADFVVTANEGDAREYFFDTLNAEGNQDEDLCDVAGGQDFDEDDGCLSYTDETQGRRLDFAAGSSLAMNAGDDPEDFDFTAFPIGRLTVTAELGDSDGDGVYENIYAYGARSFTIWDSNGLVVFDSGDDFERITASVHGDEFNNNDDANEGDSRSANKGPEPEALTIGTVGDRTYAFIGLERMGGIFVYDITNPYNTQFVEYVINRDTTEGANLTGDSAPEGMVFVSADQSPSGNALVVIGNEISGTVTIWQVTPN
ncbi:choice-of-anchor I family protein [Planctobacterium marinum]|uniref:choice-of-anchor I family protein n=1 Tax=Planctobacterium marinum TaxID=1631968 RepID=UPI001E385DD9|nr:choice-of-anchor I family protein [Planctobacterium marinum]MCC2604600.1 choice-of-anchor I family protein [Planctobacterium marinum]